MSEVLDLIFLCAGRGLRVGLDVPKQFVPLGGRPMLLHSLAVFARLPGIRRKLIVHDPVDAPRLAGILAHHGITGCELIPGGATRQESVRRGLASASTPRVLTHNAAVPFITPGMIDQVLRVDADCVTTATEVQDNLVRVAGPELQPVPRAGVQVINSPQVFATDTFRRAHARAFAEGRTFNSDSELMLHYGHSVVLVPGPAWSFKVTDRVDLALAATILHRPDLFPGYCVDVIPEKSHPEPVAAHG